MGSEALARLVSRRLPGLGMLSNLVEFPAVPKGQARFRLQVMARHSQHDIVEAVQRLSTAVGLASEDLEALQSGATTLATLNLDRPVTSEGASAPSPVSSAPLFATPGSLAA
jgi:glycine C-acetyltransferase